MPILQIAHRVIVQEIQGLQNLLENLPVSFQNTVKLISNLKGKIITSGIGKSGYIARKIAASFSSIGSAAMYIHPAEASHGDLGMITQDDVVIILSNSGETRELFDIVKYCKRFKILMIAITMKENSTIAKNSDYLLNIPKLPEASQINAPTTSALMMLALGDALMVAVQESKGISEEDFHVFHPGGKLGAGLVKIKDIMHTGDHLPVVYPDTPASEVIITITQKRLGCAAVIENKKLVGVITDGDLRRHMNDNIIRQTAEKIMTSNPKTISPDILAAQALTIMEDNNITSLLVVDKYSFLGIVHVHDLLKIGVV